MIKLLTALFLTTATFMHAEEMDRPMTSTMEESGFVVNVTAKEAQVINELLTTMGESSVVSLLFKRSHLKSIAKKLRPVSSTQFLGYVFERPHLIKMMKKVHKSSTKWENLTRSIVRGLKKESQTTLFDNIPCFAKHTRSNKNVLYQLAKEERWNDFIVHVLEMN